MQLDELSAISRTLPIGWPDQNRDAATLSAALASYSGRIATALEQPGAVDQADLAKNCGALLIVLVAIADGRGLALDDVVRAGEQELRSE